MSNTAPNVEQLSPLQRSVLVIKEMKEKLEQVENKQTEPIAIVGMGCRFPGGANSPESFWKLLRDGVDGITEVPPERWDINAYYDPNPETANKMYCKYGGFLDEIDKFDAEFFGLTPREATSLDPQQRLLLEVSWETLENAGIAPDKLNGSKTGVFIGISLNEYAQQAVLGAAEIDVYTATGNALSVAAGSFIIFSWFTRTSFSHRYSLFILIGSSSFSLSKLANWRMSSSISWGSLPDGISANHYCDV